MDKQIKQAGKRVICFLALTAMLAVPMLVMPAMAATSDLGSDYLGQVGTASGLPGGSDNNEDALIGIIGTGINVILSILGVVLVLIIIYAGWTWMMSQGVKDKVQKAKDMLLQAVIGLLIIFAAYAIATFVIGSLTTIVGGTNN